MQDTRNLAILAIITVSFALTMIMVMPMVPVYASSLGASEVGVGFLVAIAPLTALLFGLPLASCAPHVGIDRLMRMAFLIGIASGALFAVAETPTMLILPQMGFGMTMSLFMPQMISYYYRISSPDRRQAMQGYNTAFQGIGSLVGPLVAGVVGGYQGLSWVFIWYALLSLGGYVVSRSLRSLSRSEPTEPLPRVALGSYRRAVKLIAGSPRLRTALFFVALMVVMWQGLGNTIFPLFIERHHAAIAMMIGILIAVREFGAVICRLLFAHICRVLSLRSVLSISIALMAVGSIMIPLVGHPAAIALACLLVGIGLGPMLPGINLLALDGVAAEDGPLAMATTNGTSQVGLMLVAPALGGMAGAYGFENTFYLAAGFCLLALFVFLLTRLLR